MKYFRLFKSRLILVPLCLAAGMIGGINITWWRTQSRMAENESLQAALYADVAALIDDGKLTEARKQSRNQMIVSAQTYAGMKVSASASGQNAMRQVSTYVFYSSDRPSAEIGGDFLTRFPPFSRVEAEQSTCTSGVCTFNKRHLSASR